MGQTYYDHTVSTTVMQQIIWKPKGYQSKWLDLAKKYNITGIIEMAEQNLYIDGIIEQMWDKPDEFFKAVDEACDGLDADFLFYYTLTDNEYFYSVSITFDLCAGEESILKYSNVNINPNITNTVIEFVTTKNHTEAYVNFFGYGDVIGYSIDDLINNDTLEIWEEHSDAVNDLYEHYYKFFEDYILDPDNTEFTDCKIIVDDEIDLNEIYD